MNRILRRNWCDRSRGGVLRGTAEMLSLRASRVSEQSEQDQKGLLELRAE